MAPALNLRKAYDIFLLCEGFLSSFCSAHCVGQRGVTFNKEQQTSESRKSHEGEERPSKMNAETENYRPRELVGEEVDGVVGVDSSFDPPQTLGQKLTKASRSVLLTAIVGVLPCKTGLSRGCFQSKCGPRILS